MNYILQELRKPYGPLIPWSVLSALLILGLWLVRSLGVESAQDALAMQETEWLQTRTNYQHHLQAQQAKKDLAQVWAALPEERDFAPLALGITEEAKRNHVTLPALSYKTETTPVPTINRGILQGTMTGKYEDLRRFMYEIETAEELVYIEDLDLVRSSERPDRMLTFNIKIATYLKAGNAQTVGQDTR
jgi:Tfp pilus assembly protein PilO